MALPRIGFRENERQVFFQDLRVFINGVEVSGNLRDRVSTSITDRDAIATATLVLDNAHDKFVITKGNLDGKYGVDDYGRYDETPKRKLVEFKTGVSGKVTRNDRRVAVTQLMDEFIVNVYLADPDAGSSIAEDDERINEGVREAISKLASISPSILLDEKARKEASRDAFLALSEHLPSLDPNDIDEIIEDEALNVRRSEGASPVAATTPGAELRSKQDNKNPTCFSTNRALYAFSEHDLVINKNDTVAIWAHNPLTENDEWYPVYTGFVNLASLNDDEITNDSNIVVQCYCIRGLMRHMRIAMNNMMTLENPRLILTKNGPGDANLFDDVIANNTAFTTFLQQRSLEQIMELLVTGGNLNDRELRGVGSFTMGRVMRYPEAGQGSTAKTSVPSASANNSDVNVLAEWHTLGILGTPERFLTYDEVTQLGEESFIGGANDPTGKQLHMLLPKEGTNVKSLETFVLEGGTDTYVMKDRFALIREVVARLDYQFYTAPSGDLLLEFPMYDFQPNDFGDTWAPLFTFERHLIGTNITPESEDIPAGVECVGNLSLVEVANNEQVKNQIRKVIAYSPLVAARYGIGDIEPKSFPFVTDIDTLKAFAVLEYQKKLADSSKMSFTAAFRPFVLPNRPLLHKRRAKMGLATSAETTWEIFGECSTDFQVRFLRTLSRESGDNGQTLEVYRFVTGGAALAISYRLPIAAGGGVDSDTEGELEKIEFAEDRGIVVANPAAKSQLRDGARSASRTQLPDNVDDSVVNVNSLEPEALDVLASIAACVKPTKLVITSAKRSKHANDAAGGQVNSKHLTGEAFDIRVRDPVSGQAVLTSAEIAKIQKCANTNGYHAIYETQETGPHIHCEKADTGETPISGKKENERARDAQLASASTTQS